MQLGGGLLYIFIARSTKTIKRSCGNCNGCRCCLSWPLVRSTRPFLCGYSGGVVNCLIPISRQKTSMSASMKAAPLSEPSSRTAENTECNIQTIERANALHALGVKDVKRKPLTYSIKQQMLYFWPVCVNGPAKSMAQHTNGSFLGTGVNCCLSFTIGTRVAHSAHVITTSWHKRRYSGCHTRCFIARSIAPTVGCPWLSWNARRMDNVASRGSMGTRAVSTIR